MSELERFRKVLEQIAYYRTDDQPNEWSEAEAFSKVQQLASEALDPASKIIRIQQEQHAQVALQRKVNALKRGERYFYVDFHRTMSGAWVRFLRGDGERSGIVHVKCLECVNNPNSSWRVGSLHRVHVLSLQSAPGVPLS